MKINSPIYTVSHLSKQTVASKTLPGQRTWQLADRRKLSFWKTHSSYFCYLDMTNDCGDCSNTGQWKAGARTYFNLVMMITMRTYILKYPWHWPAMSRGKWPKFLFSHSSSAFVESPIPTRGFAISIFHYSIFKMINSRFTTKVFFINSCC